VWNSPVVTIRDATEADTAALAGLVGQLGYPTDEAAVRRRLARIMSSAADRLFVAEVDGRVVGLAGIHTSPSLEHDRDAAKVSTIVVDEAFRGAGIGRALLDAVEAEARARDCALVFLTTAERRTDAHEFYRELGWEETGRRFAKTL
jgi:N-acetylglutamate synthase-like GNAT family acetyltransferase